MQDKYEEAIKETFKYLNDYLSNPNCKLSCTYAEAIQAHMKTLGFMVYCTSYPNIVVVYPMKDNLPIHIWRKK